MQAPHEQIQSAIESLAKGIDLDPHLFGGRGSLKPSHVHEFNGVPIVIGKSGEAVSKSGQPLRVGVPGLLVHTGELCFQPFSEQPFQPSFVPTAGSEMHQHVIAGDATQPRCERTRFIERVEPLPGRDRRLLEELVPRYRGHPRSRGCRP